MSSKRFQNKLDEESSIKDVATKYLKSILATAIENDVIVSENKLREILEEHNMAYAEYNVDRVSNSCNNSGCLIAHSKVSTRHNPINPLTEYGFVALKPKEERVFKHIDVGKARNIKCEPSHPRQGDSEAKILERLAEIFVLNSRGVVHLYTQYEPCLSCDYEIIQFLEMFPNIELVINYDLDYN
ncbi:hypothetical protein CON78_26080 [Bacillus toyonensis]|uniref:deaminase domain-containing protein n=1 Tax=Bacillus toyonensis TaxID=155322 RepID=UPI000BEE6EBC|nr:deaminase domain-containing protein [Bacillus toyonensis]MCG3795995.1 hypothetical protein [Bacillus toyonensis]PED97813.1 hypothetical protein CON78_26080 [Bacillus toyonensis]